MGDGTDLQVVETEATVAAATYARNRREAGDRVVYHESDPTSAVPSPDADTFFELSYNQTLATMIAHVVEAEGPIREDVLAKRIARAHGWSRTGGRIRERVLKLAKKSFPTTKEDVGLFVWPISSDGGSWNVFRRPNGDDIRSIDEIAMPELVSLALDLSGAGLMGEDAVAAMAKEAGLKKLRAATRERLENALAELAKAVHS